MSYTSHPPDAPAPSSPHSLHSAGARANLDAFIDQVASVGGMALITLEPNAGLATVTDAAIADFAALLRGSRRAVVRALRPR